MRPYGIQSCASQILLFGAEFTQVYAARAGRAFVPDNYAVRA